MRKILEFPETNSQLLESQKLETIKQWIKCMAEDPNRDWSQELEELGLITGKHHTVMEFVEYWEWTDLETLVRLTLTPEPPCIRDISQKEVEEMVLLIREYMATGQDDKEKYYRELLHKSLPLTNVTDYILSGKTAIETAEAMVKAAKGSIIIL
ncbi:MAG: hypothetical protein IKM28_06785 [Lachnospiraceae bacterium]|nr:hypothetical protein [Lachnospiraceae bacterium]